MAISGSPPTDRNDREEDGATRRSCEEKVASLKAASGSLLGVADTLEQLTGDLGSSGVGERARALAGDLRTALAACLDKEAAVLQGLGRPRTGRLRNAVERTRREHSAMRGLAAPVLAGLRALGQNRFPTPVNRFAFAANVLCVFIRMHVQFKNEALYPLLAGALYSAQADAETGPAGRHMAAAPAGARKTERKSAHEWRLRKKVMLGRQRMRVPPPDPRTADMLVRLFGGPVPGRRLSKASETD